MISFLFFVTTAFANTTTQWRFESVNKQGHKETYILQKIGTTYSFNGKSLGKNLNAKELKLWKTLTAGPNKEAKRICVAGDFTFSITKNNSQKSYQGCADGSAYAKYRIALDEIYNVAKSKK